MAAVLAVSSTAAARSKPSPAKSIASAQAQLKHLKRSFARGKATKIQRSLSSSRKSLKRRRNCAAITSLDSAHNLLLVTSTWKKKAVPRTVRRKIAPALDKVERKLAPSTKGCVVKSRNFSKPRSTRVGGSGFRPNVVPPGDLVNDQGDDEEEGHELEFGQFHAIGKHSKPTTPGSNPQFAHSSAFGPISVFSSTNLGLAPRSGGEPKEPTVAIGHNVAWYTGNTSVGYSVDAGKTWTTVDPSTILPDPVNNGLCCDQQVIYAPAQNIFVWVLQYFCPVSAPPGGAATGSCGSVNGNNIIRFAVATPEDIRTQAAAGTVGKAWHIVWDLTPQQLGEKANAWFDYSTLSVNDWYVNWTVDILEGTNSALSMRINLASLAQYGFQSNYIWSNWHTVAAQEPPGTTESYFAANQTLDQIRVYDWLPNSSFPTIHDIYRDRIPTIKGAITGGDGNDWNARAAGGLLGAPIAAAWSRGKLVVANQAFRDQCAANCDPSKTTSKPTIRHIYDHPAIWLQLIDTRTYGRFADFSDIWSPTLNYSWPSLGVAKSGTMGITFLSSSDNANPVPVVGFLDVHEHDIDNQTQQIGDPNAGPQPGVIPPGSTVFSGGTGDYYSLLPGTEYESLVMPYRSLDPNPIGGFSDNWHFVSYGHGQALAPTPPSVRFRAPVAQTNFPQGSEVTFWADISDNQDIEIPYNAINWTVDGGATFLHGPVANITFDTVGDHVVTVFATNGEGLTTTKSITVTIESTTPTTPTVRITSPLDGSGFTGTGSDGQGEYADVNFVAQANDPQGKPLSFRWDDVATEKNQSESIPNVSQGLSPTLRLHVHETNCGQSVHKLTLTVTNGTEIATRSVQVTISASSCVK
jgi:PKD domain